MARRNISKNASRRLSQLARIIARDGENCVWCGAGLGYAHPDATIEHVLPVSTGGANEFENMLLACASCNHHRQSTPALDWLTGCETRGLAADRTAVLAGLHRAHNSLTPACS